MSWMVPGRLPQEGPEPRLGPGISRPKPTDVTREYRVQVTRPGFRPMRVTIPAPTKAKALTYCQNRWPDATVAALP